jgi:transcriptional regulator with XRE-family HTH domain
MVTRLEILRRDRGLSRRQLAEQILFSREHLGKLERGDVVVSSVSPRLRRDLEGIFGESLESLLSPVL